MKRNRKRNNIHTKMTILSQNSILMPTMFHNRSLLKRIKTTHVFLRRPPPGGYDFCRPRFFSYPTEKFNNLFLVYTYPGFWIKTLFFFLAQETLKHLLKQGQRLRGGRLKKCATNLLYYTNLYKYIHPHTHTPTHTPTHPHTHAHIYNWIIR